MEQITFKRLYLVGYVSEFTADVFEEARANTQVLICAIFETKSTIPLFVKTICNHVVVFPYESRKFYLEYLFDNADTLSTACILTKKPRLKSLRHTVLSFEDIMKGNKKRTYLNMKEFCGGKTTSAKDKLQVKAIQPSSSHAPSSALSPCRTPSHASFNVSLTCAVPEQLNLPVSVVVPDVLARKNSHWRDARIKFEEENHIYTVEWEDGSTSSKTIVSTSGVVKEYFSEFHPDAVIDAMMERKNWPKSKYYGKTASEIKSGWSELGNAASAAGTAHHLTCELFYNGVYPPEPHSKSTLQFLDFAYSNITLEPFRTEWRIWTSSKLQITGTIDMVFRSRNRDPSNKILYLLIYDWKNCKQIKFKDFFSKDTGKPPFSDLPNTNYSHYSIQLNIYKYILENFYAPIVVDGISYEKIEVENMFLVVMHENLSKYNQIMLPDYSKRIEEIFNARLSAPAPALSESDPASANGLASEHASAFV
jgi:hypothetical protein